MDIISTTATNWNKHAFLFIMIKQFRSSPSNLLKCVGAKHLPLSMFINLTCHKIKLTQFILLISLTSISLLCYLSPGLFTHAFNSTAVTLLPCMPGSMTCQFKECLPLVYLTSYLLDWHQSVNHPVNPYAWQGFVLFLLNKPVILDSCKCIAVCWSSQMTQPHSNNVVFLIELLQCF